MHLQDTHAPKDSVVAGKVCTHCGMIRPASAFNRRTASPDGLQPLCRECQRHKAHAYYLAHRAQVLAKVAAYAAAHRDERSAYMTHWTATHREEQRARKRQYFQATKAQRAAYERAKRRADPQAYRARRRHTWAKNPQKYWAIAHRATAGYRARRAQAKGRYTLGDIALLRETQQGRCAYCQRSLAAGWHVEHMTPLSRGGTNWPCNLCLACPLCNDRKGSLTAGQFLARLLSRAP